MKIFKLYNAATAAPVTAPAASATPSTGSKSTTRTRAAVIEQRLAASGSDLQRLLALTRRKPLLTRNKTSRARARLRSRGAIAHRSGDGSDETGYEEAGGEGEGDAMTSSIGVGSRNGAGQQGAGSQQEQREQQHDPHPPHASSETEDEQRTPRCTVTPRDANRTAPRRPATLDVNAAQAALLALLIHSRSCSTQERMEHAAMRIIAASLHGRAHHTSLRTSDRTLSGVRHKLVEANAGAHSAPRASNSFNPAQQRLHLLMPLFMLNLHTPRLSESIDRSRATLLALSRD